MTPRSRPSMEEYLMGIALAVRVRADCIGAKVGALIAQGNHIVSTGYNGTPYGIQNCSEGGCERCAHRDDYGPGVGYDICICVHAEQNALMSAAKFGISARGAALYTTMQPCFGCIKEALQAGIARVVYLHPWPPLDKALQAQYSRVRARFIDFHQLTTLTDPEAAWANPQRRAKLP